MPFVTYNANEGICNRLRTHLIAHAYSKRINKPLVIQWRVVQACGVNFSDLFDLTDNFIEFKDSSLRTFVLNRLDPLKIRFNGYQGNLFAGVDAIPIPKNPLRYIEFGETFSPWAYSSQFNILGEFKKHCIDCLKPNYLIRKKIANIAQQFSGNMVGIHIRRGDFKISFSKHMLPLSFYIETMTYIQNTYPKVCFFLSTDDCDFVKPLLEKFQIIIQTKSPRDNSRSAYEVFGYENKCNRDTKQGCYEAVVDLYSLKESKVIIGSPNSSFSSMAGFIGGKRVLFPDPHKIINLSDINNFADKVCSILK